MFFLLCGRPPFMGPDFRSPYEKMAAHVNRPAPSVRRLRADVPEKVAAILQRLLSKSPDDRYAAPTDVADALEDFTAGSDLRLLMAEATGNPRTSRPDGDTTANAARAPTPIRSYRRAPRVFAVLALAIVVTTSALVYFGRDVGDLRPGERVKTAATQPQIESEAGSELPGWIVVSWTLEGLGKPDLWLFRADGGARHQVTNNPRVFDVHPAFSRDGRQIAFVRGVESDQSNSIWICSSDGSRERELVAATHASERFFAPVWLSSSRLGYTRDPQIGRRPDMEFWSVDVRGGAPELAFRFQDLPTRGNGLVTCASPDGEQLSVVAQDGLLWTTADVYVADRQGRILATVWEDDPDDCKDARALWSFDGRKIAWHHNFTHGALAQEFYYGVGVAQLGEDGEWEARLQTQHDEFVTPLAWAPHGDDLLCARMSRDTDRVTLFLMDEQLRPSRELFDLSVHGWQPGQRDFARLADWAIVPPELQPR
jgi:dipeptidyl aminopeptidase/acylaminoacyl peptidase